MPRALRHLLIPLTIALVVADRIRSATHSDNLTHRDRLAEEPAPSVKVREELAMHGRMAAVPARATTMGRLTAPMSGLSPAT